MHIDLLLNFVALYNNNISYVIIDLLVFVESLDSNHHYSINHYSNKVCSQSCMFPQ